MSPSPADHCLDFARTLASHYQGDNRLHNDSERAHEIFQASTITALLDAVYDGGLTYAELEQHGDFGLGTFNALDGEMVAVDGDFFHLRPDGSAAPVQPEELTPFAAVTFFESDSSEQLSGPMTRDEFEAHLTANVPSPNIFYALRIDGRFSSLRTRTVARQSRPYRPLVQATSEQTVNEFLDIGGVVAGFRAPDYAQGITVGGYHLHFIDDSRTRGGHVLDFTLQEGLLRVELEAGLHVELPTSSEFLEADLSGRDLDKEITKAERG
jgi:acetolactate decarboxylase